LQTSAQGREIKEVDIINSYQNITESPTQALAVLEEMETKLLWSVVAELKARSPGFIDSFNRLFHTHQMMLLVHFQQEEELSSEQKDLILQAMAKTKTRYPILHFNSLQDRVTIGLLSKILANQAKRVASLYLTSCVQLSNNVVSPIASYCPNLRVLNLDRCASLTELTGLKLNFLVKAYLRECSALRRVSVQGEALSVIDAECSPKLESLQTTSRDVKTLRIKGTALAQSPRAIAEVSPDFSTLVEFDSGGATEKEIVIALNRYPFLHEWQPIFPKALINVLVEAFDRLVKEGLCTRERLYTTHKDKLCKFLNLLQAILQKNDYAKSCLELLALIKSKWLPLLSVQVNDAPHVQHTHTGTSSRWSIIYYQSNCPDISHLLQRHTSLPRAPDALAAALKDPDSDVRCCAAWSLGRHDFYHYSMDTLDALLICAEDKNDDVRVYASWALAQSYFTVCDQPEELGRKQHKITRTLIKCLGDPLTIVAENACRGIQQALQFNRAYINSDVMHLVNNKLIVSNLENVIHYLSNILDIDIFLMIFVRIIRQNQQLISHSLIRHIFCKAMFCERLSQDSKHHLLNLFYSNPPHITFDKLLSLDLDRVLFLIDIDQNRISDLLKLIIFNSSK
jgi:hypothetical protein